MFVAITPPPVDAPAAFFTSRPAPVVVAPRAVTVTPSFSRPYVAPRVVVPAPVVAPKPAYVPPPIYYAPRPVYPAPVYAPPPAAAPPAKVPFWKRLFTRKPKAPAALPAPAYGQAAPAPVYGEPAYGAPAYAEAPMQAAPPAVYAQAAPVVVRESGTAFFAIMLLVTVVLIMGAFAVILVKRKD